MRALLTILLAIVACDPVAPTGTPSPTTSLSFVFTSAFGLTALDAKGQDLGSIVELPADSFPSGPVLFPDRRSIAFSIALVPTGTSSFGSDIWAVDLDGKSLRRLVEHERENVFYAAPLIDPSGKFLYFHRRAAIIQNGTYLGNQDSIERLDLVTKQRTRLVEKATDPTLSPDGKTILYVHFEAAPKGLWRVSPDGTGARPFFSIKDEWVWMQAPRFSPDGSVVIFSGAGHTASLRGNQKLAHLGIPSELYLAPPDGSAVKSISRTGDDVIPSWSPDGKEVAFAASGALTIVNTIDGTARQLRRDDKFFAGEVLWVRR